MKTKQYVTKYDLSSGKKFDHSHFVGDLTIDFMSLLELGRKDDGSYTLKGFENTVHAIRQKWDGIHNKTVPGLPEKLWRYFYATVIVKTRDKLFPEEVIRRQQKKDDWEARQKVKNERDDWYFESWSKFIFSNILGSMFKDNAPVKDFSILGLTETDDTSAVNKAYKKLSMLHHPDKGGKQDKFIEITDAKNRCLAYLQTKI